MTSSTRVPQTEVTGLYGALIKRMSRRMLGEVPESLGVLWHHPAVLKDTLGFSRRSERWNRLDSALATYAVMAAAATVGCDACLDLNYFLSRGRGVDPTKAREVPQWRDSMRFTQLERAVMAYAEAMSRTPPEVTDEQSAELLDRLGAPALIELTAKVAVMNMAARSNIALGITAQGFSDACGLPPLATRAGATALPSST